MNNIRNVRYRLRISFGILSNIGSHSLSVHLGYLVDLSNFQINEHWTCRTAVCRTKNPISPTVPEFVEQPVVRVILEPL